MAQLPLRIDGRCFAVDFVDPETPLHGRYADGRRWSLAPLRFAEHCRLLDRHLSWSEGRLTLDQTGYADAFLAARGEPEADLRGVALWWSAGAPAHEAQRPPGPRSAALRPWTHRERLRALKAARVNGPDGARLQPVPYLRAMLRCSTGHGDDELDALDAGRFQPLLRAVCAINGSEDLADDLGELDETQRARVLACCRCLGWTPSQVLDTAACEIDALLRLLDFEDGASASRPIHGHSAWVNGHDAVVIRVEEDPA